MRFAFDGINIINGIPIRNNNDIVIYVLEVARFQSTFYDAGGRILIGVICKPSPEPDDDDQHL